MRPVRLELEGFTAFRRRAVVDLAGADLFALCGPTGAGKTSLIDAMTFALYGSVPRLDERSVAPVIAQGLAEARVRFDFTVAGLPYVAVRVVRGTKSGATTREARLEAGDGTVLAGDAKAVTAAVTDLLGLDFRQFTTCVSLPQGEFARFLHAEPRHRQDLLVRLLDLGLYERVGQAARHRAALAEQAAAVTDGRLGKLADATPEAAAAAAGAVAALVRLRADVAGAEPEVAAAREAERAAAAAAEAVAAALATLGTIDVPAGVGDLAASLAAAEAARDAAAAAERDAHAALAGAESALAALPAPADLEAARRDGQEVERLATLAERGRAALAEAATAAEEADRALETARAAAGEAEAALAEARNRHLAHTLAAEVVVGAPCPVCQQVVAQPPAPPPADVAAAEAARAAAEAALAAAGQRAAAAATERSRVEGKLAGVRDDLADAERRWSGHQSLLSALTPDGAGSAAGPLAALDAALATVGEAEERVTAARTTAAAAHRTRAAADERHREAVADADAARRAFDAARDQVAALGPPPAARVDLAADWAGLAAWAADRRPALEAERQRHEATAAEHRRRAEAVAADVVAACAGAGVAVRPGPDPATTVAEARGAVADALARAEAEERRIAAAIEEAAQLQAEVAAHHRARDVARAVADHLAAHRFERWLLEEALAQLVAGATVLLRELSAGAYSLAVDDRGAFVVVDHVNADQVRSARTLSGGETFLASLALALALADQVAGLAAGGAARLETILLDEGFGTLDPETLETVAAALEELGARGRTVGIVTHVAELAERLPVRVEVRKVGGSATVERVDQ